MSWLDSTVDNAGDLSASEMRVREAFRGHEVAAPAKLEGQVFDALDASSEGARWSTAGKVAAAAVVLGGLVWLGTREVPVDEAYRAEPVPSSVVTELDASAGMSNDVANEAELHLDAAIEVSEAVVLPTGTVQGPSGAEAGVTQEGTTVEVAVPVQGRMVPLLGLSADGMNQQAVSQKLQQEKNAAAIQTERLNATIEVKQ
jgi:hypothetical protein